MFKKYQASIRQTFVCDTKMLALENTIGGALFHKSQRQAALKWKFNGPQLHKLVSDAPDMGIWREQQPINLTVKYLPMLLRSSNVSSTTKGLN